MRRRSRRCSTAIQEHLLPDGTTIPGLTLARLYRPATEVAGDYYDLLSLSDGNWLICLVDVSGHGVPAAMGAAMLDMFLGAVETRTAPESHSACRQSPFRHHLPDGIFGGPVFLGALVPETGRLDYVNAGHPAPRRVHA